ncbi:hypothetical protein OJF2_28060 [Aquisphaera giovannonii]|uniref:Uncharacterized protein n=1 Tax=Aquisphaera giovannonii TaxID=406548 RepID=A0A5B9W2B9_9BACT|nr:hypothetical protein [Aquisphaera giovannonii]QEH34271.1 hypothetical protein OJF2_28060 [Aquisphaera giovannonii]
MATIEELEARIAATERQLAAWRRRAIAAAVAGAALLACGWQAGQRDLKVRSIVVGDEDGPMARLGANSSGGFGISVFKRGEELAGTFGVTEKGSPFLGLYDRKDDKPNVRPYMLLGDNGPTMSLLDSNGETVFRAPQSSGREQPAVRPGRRR